MTHQHSLEYIKSTLERIELSLFIPITTYHIGGNAMCWYGLKNTTKDTDIVLIDEKGIKAFEKALLTQGFSRTDEHIDYKIGEPYARYVEIKNTPLSEKFTPGLAIDLFLRTICGKIEFSSEMISRCVDAWNSENLENKICSKEDIFIFKAVAGRSEDIKDMASLVESGLELDLIIAEYNDQLSKLPKDISVEIRSVFIDSVSSLRSRGVKLPTSFIREITKF